MTILNTQFCPHYPLFRINQGQVTRIYNQQRHFHTTDTTDAASGRERVHRDLDGGRSRTPVGGPHKIDYFC